MKWSEDDLALLKRMDDRGVRLDDMAERLKRPKRAVEVKLYFVRLGPEGQAQWRAIRRLQDAARQTGGMVPTKRRLAKAAGKARTVPPIEHGRWHGRCPAFRPRTDADANRETRL